MSVKLINGDCSNELRLIEDNSVDMILIDPPYGINYRSNSRIKSEKFQVLKNDDNDTRLNSYKELYRVLKNNSVCVVFASWKNYSTDYKELSKIFNIKNTIIWWKHGGGLGDLKHTLLTDYEVAIVCHKGKCRIRGKREGSVWECSKINPSKMVHPTEKPVELLEKLILKYSDENDTILDCFMGSGSTGIACKNIGRKFIGIELDEKYFEIAKKRIGSVYNGNV